MAHHPQHSHDNVSCRGFSHPGPRGFTGIPIPSEDDLTSDVDEPPDSGIRFAKLMNPKSRSANASAGHEYTSSFDLAREQKESLLTQALLSSPELNPHSDAEAPVLTSDGGLTSPARTTTPSPPPPMVHTGIELSHSLGNTSDSVQIAPAGADNVPEESSVEAGLGRKRCISFACGRQSATQRNNEQPAQSPSAIVGPAKFPDPLKRPCMLRFACPMKPARTENHKSEIREKSPNPPQDEKLSTETTPVNVTPEFNRRKHRDSDSTIRNSSCQNMLLSTGRMPSRKGKSFNRVDFQKSEATRFHEFAGFNTEDEWTNEQTAHRQKITVNDTLRKENAIRKLAEEAEEEALDEEAQDGVAYDDDEDDSKEENDENVTVDDGNETDDEGGFADSDDDSDCESDYQFWTPGLTTAATSADHLEQIRPAAHRVTSDSSIESIINTKRRDSAILTRPVPRHSRVRPGTPDLPDSSDFVVGTIDEDRPLEAAYISCLEERRRSKHKLIPQDIDPSFPTSEPEADKDEDEVEDEDDDYDEDDDAHVTAPEHVMRSSKSSEDGESLPKSTAKATKPSTHLARRMQSPPPKQLQSLPPKRMTAHPSPQPRRLFGQSTHRLRSPPPLHRRISSPPSSRRPSISGPQLANMQGIDVPCLAQRPNLTHTSSLPRTPNPFWSLHRKSRFAGSGVPSADTHSRGPIDIVQGLETKRQRRKDKYWRQHCRAVGKDKDRRCQPGKGAERMKELGLEMADRCRGYGQKAQLVLSV